MKLEQLQTNTAIRGIVPDALVTVVSVRWFGSEALELTDKTAFGKVANELPYRHDDPRPALVEQGRPCSLDGDGALFRVVSEAQRIRLAHLFDPVLAGACLDRRAAAVSDHRRYETMLPRQPLRFPLADDPGVGKTLMAGLLSNLEPKSADPIRIAFFGQRLAWQRTDAGEKPLEVITDPMPDRGLGQLLRSFSHPALKQGRDSRQCRPRWREVSMQSG